MDLIEREDVYLAITAEWTPKTDTIISNLIRAIKVIPNAERPTGHWIDMGSGQECSECGEIQYGYDNFRYFCANCGAKMQ